MSSRTTISRACSSNGSGAIAAPKPSGTSSNGADWPCYRGDAWRSGSTAAAVPSKLDVLWTADLGDRPDGKLLEDWKQNLFVAGPVTPPVIAGGRVFVARSDAHQLVALDAATGRPRWRFTANGRVDGPPTIHAGLCLFGTRSGWVYCLRAADGKRVWRRRAARDEDRIVSFGQLESPWPVAGSVLVFEGVAYFAAGRQALADGGVLVFAVDPATGKARWISRIHKLPMRGYYGGAGLEFDPIDLMVAEAPRPTADSPTGPGRRDDFVTMSRWRIDRRTGRPEAMWKSGFGYYRTGQGGVMASRGVWTYGPRMEYHAATPQSVRTARRPLMVFRDNVLIGSSNDGRRLFRREFTDADAAAFNDEWFNQRHVPRRRGQKGDRNRSERLARRAKWTVDAFDAASAGNRIAAMALTAEKVFLLGQGGGLRVFAADSGKLLADRPLPAAVWDGLAAAGGSLYLTAADGKVFRLGSK